MKKLFSLVLLVLCFTVFADTDIPAGDVSGNWLIADSPFNINGEIQIPAGETLTIDPGVTVNFTGHYKFKVLGTITAIGNEGNEITFTAANDVAGWHGLRFTDITTSGQDASQLSYCNFQYGRATGISPDYQGGAVYAVNSSDITFQYCSFSNCSATTGGAMYLQNSAVTMNFVEITNNEVSGAGGGIYLNGSDITLTDSEITGNTSIYDGAGMNCYNSDPTMTRVIIAGNENEWNGGGISAFNDSNPVMTKVTIVDNSALQDGSAIAVLYNSSITMVNSIVWDNANNGIYVEQGAALNATYSDLDDGTGQSYFGTGCINQDPMFVNQAAGNYALSWENAPTPDDTMSPCIDSGDPDGDTDPDGTVADMGAVYYPQTGIEGTVTLVGGTGSVSDVEITVTLTVPPNTEFVTNPDAGGNYMITLPSGTYDVIATLDGYSSFTQEDLEVSAELVTLDFSLTPPPPGEIVGEVQLEGIGDPTEVLIQAGDITTNPYAVYDPDTGYISFWQYSMEISPGTYDVTATLAGYVSQIEEDVIVESGQETPDIDFYLPLVLNEGTITGTITLVGGAGDVEDVVITAGEDSTSPEADGTYELTILNGTYDVYASLDGYSSLSEADVVVTAFQATEDIDFDLVDGWNQISGTLYSMTVFATVTYDGEFLDNSASNQFAAFGPDDDCRGTATWIPGNHYFWDNPFDLSGFWYFTIVSDDQTGTEPITFDFYNSDTGTIEDCNEGVTFSNGSYDTGVNFSIDSPLSDITYDLNENWNWVSFNRIPENSAVEVVFDPLTVVPDVFQVKNQTHSTTYTPGVDVWGGGLNNITYSECYKINMINDFDDFTVTGSKINPIIAPINIVKGYNWLGYIPDTELEIADALQSLTISDSTCIKSQNQSAVYFGAWIGDLQTLEPGKGYLLNWPTEITDPVYLTYPPAEEETRAITKANISNLDNWNLASGYQSNMILMAELSSQACLIDNDQLYSVGAFDQNDNCRSIAKLENGFWYFTIIGDVNELLEIRVYDKLNDSTSIADESIDFVANSIIGSPTEPLSITLETGDVPAGAPAMLSSNNYPNPFNPSTAFEYSIPQDTQVALDIYNSKGQLVKTLVDEFQNAGEYRIEWNATGLSSGIYFYKLSAGAKQITRKCILMK